MKNQNRTDAHLTRREFVTAATSLTLTLTLSPYPMVREANADAPLPINIWVTIETDGTISIVSPAAELGQGTFTALPAVFADELDADWSKVKPVYPPVWDEKLYGNPQWNGLFNTTASLATRGYFKPMRIAGAQARRVLIEAAAERWAVPAAELSTEPSFVVHKASGRRMSYGEIAGFAKAPASLPPITEADLKNPEAFRYIGKDVKRIELPAKVNGSAKYGIDFQLPGMLYAAVLQSPYEGGAPRQVDDAAARSLTGVSDVVRLPAGVAVLGHSVEATQKAKAKLKIEWTDAPAARLDSERALEEFAKIARDKSKAGVTYTNSGDVETAMRRAARVFRGEYRTRLTYHAQMEPMNATAVVAPDGKSAEIWVGTQNPSGLHNDVARLLETDRSRITFHQHLVGGGFGRRGGPQDVVLDAVRLAKASGKPVKVIWTREDDMAAGKFRPMTAHHIEAGLDAAGKLLAWHHRVVADSVQGYRARLAGTKPPEMDAIVMQGTPLPQYPIPNKRAEHVIEVLGARLSSMRGVGVFSNAFAVESFIDEMAKELGKDPLAFRFELSHEQPRVQDLLHAVAEMSDWKRPRDGRGLGLAVSEKGDTLAAGVAEVSLDRANGKIRVHNIWAAIDAGLAVQPKNIVAQTEGGIVLGLGHVLREKITIRQGRVQESNFNDYQVPRMADMPRIEVRVLSTDNPPTGVGEDGVPLVAGAVGNAIAALTGVRLRELPFEAERVRAALGS
ncbi:MAG TPA: molybdopterin cofactor-binding domain-containing protein [Xanthobacteraceae bacterium]|nr:molybdopterin cofactor-binding domain-containing protein [Xanthobacteraceae bacterium]